MAIHNSVLFYGQVKSAPTIVKNADGEAVRAMCGLNIIRGVRDLGHKADNVKFDCPVVMTENKHHIAEMEKWEANDMVEIKGTVTTREINKKTRCPKCEEVNRQSGNMVYVSPIYMSRREGSLTNEQGLALLKERMEISNQVLLVGTLCMNPQTYETEKGLKVTQYPLAINRKYRIYEDPDNKKLIIHG